MHVSYPLLLRGALNLNARKIAKCGDDHCFSPVLHFFVGIGLNVFLITLRCLLSTPVQLEVRRSDSNALSSRHKTLLPYYGSISGLWRTSIWAGLAEGRGTPVQWAGRLM